MNDVLVKVDGVSKKFCRSLKKSLLYGMQDLGNEILGRQHGGGGQLRPDEFWAVNDVSFELKRGECLGLIGRNGAGKSTLLKMLNGLNKVDKGSVEMDGRVGALIELGSGFNPILTGRENIYVNGSVLGFTKREIDEKFDAIVGFAEIEEFLDTPVKNYSSGMKVRLGFAVAAQMEPDVLIIDEVLAVGDVGFRVKCLNRIHELLDRAAVIFVSHSMPFVARLCNQVLVMDKGVAALSTGDVGAGIDYYHGLFSAGARRVAGSGEVQMTSISVNDQEESSEPLISFGGSMNLKMQLSVQAMCKQLSSRIVIWDPDQKPILDVVGSDHESFTWENTQDEMCLNVSVSTLCLAAGKYTFTVVVFDPETTQIHCRVENAMSFVMEHSLSTPASMLVAGKWSLR